MAARSSKMATNGSIAPRKTRRSGSASSSIPRLTLLSSNSTPRPRHGWRSAKMSCLRSTTPFTKSRTNKPMKTTLKLLTLILTCSTALADKTASTPTKPRIEVCFVLDTAGSMGGLIEGAKQKIWSIANEMISAKPTPELKLSLVGYRDRGDEYVVKSFSLTDDIDEFDGHLRDFRAGGGGDPPESVKEARAKAI